MAIARSLSSDPAQTRRSGRVADTSNRIPSYFALKRIAAILLLSLALGLPIIAQEGYPLKGSWIGVWESNTQHGNDVLMVMNWDGKNVSGIINPGTDNIKIDKATLDPSGWKVHIEADAKNKQGGARRYVIDGTIQNLQQPNRAIVGTWQSQGGRGKFEIHRQ
jgi:hypothetical protein